MRITAVHTAKVKRSYSGIVNHHEFSKCNVKHTEAFSIEKRASMIFICIYPVCIWPLIVWWAIGHWIEGCNSFR